MLASPKISNYSGHRISFSDGGDYRQHDNPFGGKSPIHVNVTATSFGGGRFYYDELAEPLPSPCEAYHWPYEAFRLSFE